MLENNRFQPKNLRQKKMSNLNALVENTEIYQSLDIGVEIKKQATFTVIIIFSFRICFGVVDKKQ